jgi:hypothetical protein
VLVPRYKNRIKQNYQEFMNAVENVKLLTKNKPNEKDKLVGLVLLLLNTKNHHLYILHTIQCNQRIFNLLFGVIKV